jgi:hypothetical protein
VKLNSTELLQIGLVTRYMYLIGMGGKTIIFETNKFLKEQKFLMIRIEALREGRSNWLEKWLFFNCRRLIRAERRSGLPDFSSHKVPKTGKLYQMTAKCTKLAQIELSSKSTWRGPSSGLKQVVQIGKVWKNIIALCSYWWVCLQKLFHLQNIPKWPQIYQRTTIPEQRTIKCTKWPENWPNGRKIDQNG